MNHPEKKQGEMTVDSRRSFMKTGVAAGVGAMLVRNALAQDAGAAADLTLTTSPSLMAAPPMKKVRIGFVGTGVMGTVHVRNLSTIEGAEIVAVCDINEANAAQAAQYVADAGHKKPKMYTRGEEDYKRMIDKEDLDLVYTATPWRWHVPICLYAMEHGKHAATEVPAAYTIDDCWALVETAEKTQKHCVQMENCNYDRPEMLIWNMIRQGLFGEILHGECGYMHDLRDIKFSNDSEGLWRWKHSVDRNGNLYPTHGLGPMMQYMDINRGDSFGTLVSMSSPARGLNAWAKEHLPDSDPRKGYDYKLGDVNSSLIQTKKGKTILVQHDTNLPRPYSRINRIQGSKGIFEGYPNTILHIEGRSPHHEWEPMEDYAAEFEHPMWKEKGSAGEGLGHGGMDYLEDYRLIKCLMEGKPTDMNVYDAASISAVTPLSEWSVANGSKPAQFPDFTRGKWQVWQPLPIVGIL